MPDPTVATSPPRTALAALRRPRFLLGGWPWRSLAYLLTTPAVAGAAAVPLGLIGLPWLAALGRLGSGQFRLVPTLVLAVLGLVLATAAGPLVALPLAHVERQRLRLVDDRPVDSGHRRPPVPGLRGWLRTRYAEQATWRELGYAILLVTAAPLVYGTVAALLVVVAGLVGGPVVVAMTSGPVTIGVAQVDNVGQAMPYAIAGAVLLPAVPYLLVGLAGAHGAVARVMLGAGADQRLREELVEVTRSRARLVDAFEAERRRIERDLHDGAQQRLVALTLQLGLARLDVPSDSPAAARIAEAHEQARQLMVELRELIHGIRPQTLTDLGLAAALGELAERSALPVTLMVDLPATRPPRAVEETAYFVAAELLTNAAKHSGAGRVDLAARRSGRTLHLEVRDDGRGGADPACGSGLTGLADRLAVLGGRMFLSSPAGGPTVVRVELPWEPDAGSGAGR